MRTTSRTSSTRIRLRTAGLAACAVTGLVVTLGAVTTGPAAAAPPPTCDGRPATIVGTSGDDTLTGTDGNDVIWAGPGDDTVRAGRGNDVVCGNSGADVLVGGAGDDRVFGLQDGIGFDRGGTYLEGDTLHGGAGDDYLDVGVDDRHVDQDDAAQNDVSYSGSPAPVDVDLGAGRATGEGTDTLVARRTLAAVGSAYDDTLTGSDRDDVLQGGAGDDSLSGLGGDDVLYPELDSAEPQPNDDDTVHGGDGDDEIYTSSGDDLQEGGAGDDILYSYTATARQDGGTGDDTLYLALVRVSGFVSDGGDGDDTVVAERSDTTPGDGPTPGLVIPYADLDETAGTLRIDWPDGEPTTGRLLGAEHVDLDPLVRWSVIGTAGDDEVDDSTGYFPLHASMRMGDDTVHGSRAGDDVNSGPGDDTVYGGDGVDRCTNTEHRFSCGAS